MEAASWLAGDILAGDPLYRYLLPAKKEATIRSWAKDIDDINRLDLRPWEDINRVLRWARGNERFWRRNILSGKTFREKFSRLYQEAGGREVQRGAKPNEEGRIVPHYAPERNRKNGVDQAFLDIYEKSMRDLEEELRANGSDGTGGAGQIIHDLY